MPKKCPRLQIRLKHAIILKGLVLVKYFKLMFSKIIKITISTSFVFLANQSFNPVKADGCGIGESHLRELGVNKAKAMARKRLGIREIEEEEKEEKL